MEIIKTILIVEDEEVLRECMFDYLEDRGYNVLSAENGQVGIESFEQNKPDLILTDLRMPKLDGFGLLKHVVAKSPSTPVIVVSGAGDIADSINALKLGAWDYILKPISDMSIISHAIDKSLQRSKLEYENLQYQNKLESLVEERTQKLKESYLFQQKIIDGIPDLLMVIDRNHNVEMTNKTGRNTYSLEVGDKYLKCYQLHSLDKPCEDCPFEEVFKTKDVFFGEQMHPNEKGEDVPFEISITPIFDEKNNVVQAIGLFRNISERKEAEKKNKELEQKLHQSEKMDAIGQLAGGVAHDFNNMLSGIMGSTEILKSYLPDEPTPMKFYNLLMEATENASALTQRLLSFARKQPDISIHLDLHQTIKDTLILLERTIDKRITIETDLSADGCQILGDPSQLSSAFLNIGINASHAMPSGGSLFISTKDVEIDELFCKINTFSLTPGKYIELEFRDTGTGIAPDVVDRIFEPFFTTKDLGKGTGLGLSAVFNTIKQHNGAVSVYSEVGAGTSFHLLFPLTKNNKNITQDKYEIIEGSGTVLVVDDEEVLRLTASAILKKIGYDVILAENGKEGLDIFAKDPDAIDVVLLDMVMPVMNGRDCFLEIKKIKPSAKVILSSGFSREHDVEQMMSEGLNGFIHKPYRTSSLSQMINKVICK